MNEICRKFFLSYLIKKKSNQKKIVILIDNFFLIFLISKIRIQKKLIRYYYFKHLVDHLQIDNLKEKESDFYISSLLIKEGKRISGLKKWNIFFKIFYSLFEEKNVIQNKWFKYTQNTINHEMITNWTQFVMKSKHEEEFWNHKFLYNFFKKNYLFLNYTVITKSKKLVKNKKKIPTSVIKVKEIIFNKRYSYIYKFLFKKIKQKNTNSFKLLTFNDKILINIWPLIFNLKNNYIRDEQAFAIKTQTSSF